MLPVITTRKGTITVSPTMTNRNTRHTTVVGSLPNPSCPLQALNGESQQKADNLQLEALRRYRMYLAGEQAAQLPEDCLDILADGLAQELLPHGHRPL